MKSITAGLAAVSGLFAAFKTVDLWPGRPAQKYQPNILFILSDDQDLQLGSVAYTPLTRKHVQEKGTEFRNHFVTTALCCPARVSLWTGLLAHNTNVTDVRPPWGGYPKFVERGFNEDFLPVWMQDAGYDTYYTGKLFNSHTVDNYNAPHVAGFNGSDFLLDPFTYDYLNASFQRNHDPPESFEGQHTTAVIRQKALGFLDDALAGDRPFFLTVAPVAPHAHWDWRHELSRHPVPMTEPIPEKQHEHLFPEAKVPRSESFNPDKPSGVGWIKDLPKQNQSVVEYNDHFYRQRLRALQGVDELVDSLVTRLERSGKLDNTYIIYTSDNGYHIGQHRLPPGKQCGFEEDIRVPFFIRGPGITEGAAVDAVTTHIDVAPTLFELAGIPLREDFDGISMPVRPDSTDARHEHVAVEFWGKALLEGKMSDIVDTNAKTSWNNTYKSVRILGNGYNLYYSVWCTNEHELYDLTADPYEVDNLYPTEKDDDVYLAGYNVWKVIARLDTVLMVLKSCKGKTCTQPWTLLHPDGSVHNLRDALQEKYDDFYRRQPRVSFTSCEDGYIPDAEGPQEPLEYEKIEL